MMAYDDLKRLHIYASPRVSPTVASLYVDTRGEKERVHFWTNPSSLPLPASTFSVSKISISLSI